MKIKILQFCNNIFAIIYYSIYTLSFNSKYTTTDSGKVHSPAYATTTTMFLYNPLISISLGIGVNIVYNNINIII